MKFRRNIKEQRLFNIVAIVSLVALIVLSICYIFTFDKDILRFIVLLFLVVGLYFFLANNLKKCYVELLEDKIIFINSNSNLNFEINIEDIIVVMIPSEVALKNKFKENAIIIKRADMHNIISYSLEIEKYIKDNLNVNIEYYDNYSKALK